MLFEEKRKPSILPWPVGQFRLLERWHAAAMARMAAHKRLSAAETLYYWAIEILTSLYQTDSRSRPLAGLRLCLLAWRETLTAAWKIWRRAIQVGCAESSANGKSTLRQYEHSQPGSRSEMPETGNYTP